MYKIKRFSKSSDKKKDHNKAKAVATLGAGTGLTLGPSLSFIDISDKTRNKVNNSDNKKVYENLIKEAKKQGTKVIEDPSYSNSAYLGSNQGKYYRKAQAYIAKKLRKKGYNNEDILSKIKSDKVSKNLGKDSIIIGAIDGPDTLANEIGHSKYMRKGRTPNGIGRLAHKLSMTSNAVRGVGVVNGYKSGVKSQKLKAEGKKESAWNKNKSWAVPLAMSAPTLIAEAAASKKGLGLLKSAGASKELLSVSKKRLGSAWGTYAGGAAFDTSLGQASRYIGKESEKNRQKREKSDKKKFK